MNRWRKKTWSVITHILLVLIALFALYPAIWVILSSFRPGTSLFSESLIPDRFTLEHYRQLFIKFPFADWYVNTLKIAVVSMVFSTLFVLLTGYAFSRFRFYGRKGIMSFLFILGMFPSFMSMIAVYILLLNMNLLNKHSALMLVYSAGAAMGYLLVKGYFDTIPKSLEEAARIDGANHLTVFFRIFLPLSRPLIVFLSVTSFAGAFNDFIFAQMVLRTKEKQTLAVGLYSMVSDQFATQFTVFAAGCVLVALPITILFMSMQRFLVEGLTAGADKG
ncbi:sugar ABC transporter permease [Paenibacillus melissococcoides]|uniref:Sugar ABC transporter permease n=1 Tax=Paenibacillus melissococcoides TaxID=2912268 RepID=A0ABM9G195_9BACL|nr:MULTISPECIES: sugar ABC transporter permease [Paenibacillus]MEB9895307.1 sugar ABC transporter permease [Bacillus cereus]CAH8244979.1 sugar ABC transporter permease [Paenibacillus melissococcoides]CAH8709546.1 sugar ABC transporter permease [Paenibacillus melissococcoides]CAH8710273.1 sugar ABC transporter permease [Paenibacillus melissococcoides]GIO78337.1 cyclodextrin transporter permease [Paenibacillus dendritiformis]